jgi:hypothetical protein
LREGYVRSVSLGIAADQSVPMMLGITGTDADTRVAVRSLPSRTALP